MSIFAVDMKKICFWVDSICSIGGVQRVTAVIAKELAKDYDVTIVTFDQETEINKSIWIIKGQHTLSLFYKIRLWQ